MEAELVGIDDTMGQVLWTQHFLAAQGGICTYDIYLPRQQKYYTTV